MAVTSAQLSLEQAPPFSVPLRFFLTAPGFGMAAGALLVYFGPELLSSRWSPLTFGLTHLITLGVLSMVMCGAILQILPVLGGVAVPAAAAVGTVVHLMLSLGTLALSIGFFAGWAIAFDVALVLLGGGLSLFVASIGVALWRAKGRIPTVIGLRASVFSLLVTLLLGVLLVALLIGYGSSPHLQQWVNLHLGWGLLGWVGLLLVGAAFQVVPLFQMTPEFPAWMRRFLLPGLFLSLIVWSLSTLQVGWSALVQGMEVVISLGFAGFAATTWYLLGRRRRRVSDVGLAFWRLVVLAILASAAVHLAGVWLPGWSAGADYPLLIGVLLLGAVALSAVSGMLHKIVPFLAWFHLQHRQMALLQYAMVSIPHIKELHPDPWGWWQFRLHLATILLGIAAIYFPDLLARPLGVLMLLAFGVLWLGLIRVAWRYRKSQRELDSVDTASAKD